MTQPDDRQRDAIKKRADELAKKSEWYQSVIDKQTQVILNAEKTIENCMVEVKAIDLAVSALRDEYRRKE